MHFLKSFLKFLLSFSEIYVVTPNFSFWISGALANRFSFFCIFHQHLLCKITSEMEGTVLKWEREEDRPWAQMFEN